MTLRMQAYNYGLLFLTVLSLASCLIQFFTSNPDESFPYAAWSLTLTILAVAIVFTGAGTLKGQTRRLFVRVLGLGGTLAAVGCTVLYGIALRMVVQAQQNFHMIPISQAAQDATIAMEDRFFYDHYGVDLNSIHRAAAINFRAGQVKQGGSTITQQLARNLFLTNNRTIFRKILELPLTFALEQKLTKRQILNEYMQIIPYGCGYVGVSQAAAGYYHVSPFQLTAEQATILVSIVPHNPLTLPSPLTLKMWQRTAIDRLSTRFQQYAKYLPPDPRDSLDTTIYPWRIPYDRGANESIPPGWRGLLWFSYLSEDTPSEIKYVSPSLKNRLSMFVDRLRNNFKIVGIRHLGVYADRGQRLDESKTSSHSFGRAIDIAGFIYADGSEARIVDHDNPVVEEKIERIESLARKDFDLVVDWKNEPRFHQNHIHLEVKP